MQTARTKRIDWKWRLMKLLIILCWGNGAFSQACPDNIGFEKGSFDGWQCSDGSIDTAGQLHLYPTAPYYNSHTLIGRDQAGVKDEYGGFPILCPNGSKYSIRLGNDGTGARAEGISYTFTVPASVTDYSIIYNYAVVLQSPGHVDYQQPRFTAKVFDVLAGSYITCSSFEFMASGSLPGFFTSPRSPGVQCKSWTAVTIDLAGYQGRELRLEFSSNDCAPGAHFGYVYLDVNDNCAAPVTGNNICENDTSITLTAPFGFATYSWYPDDFSVRIGSGNSINITPPPPTNTRYAVIVTPYAGLGCKDTLITTVKTVNDQYTLKVLDPVEACLVNGADLTEDRITAGSTGGLTLTYHTNIAADTFLSGPNKVLIPGVYYIKGVTDNGCRAVRPVTVVLQDSPLVAVHSPPAVTYPATIDITAPGITAGSQAGLVFDYWKNGAASQPLEQPSSIRTSGTYFIRGASGLGCTSIQPVVVVINPPPPYELIAPNIFTPNGDGVHDRFMIQVKGQMQAGLMNVYDRWGGLVFQGEALKGWDGKRDGKPLPTGAYYWVIRGVDLFLKRNVVNSGVLMLVN